MLAIADPVHRVPIIWDIEIFYHGCEVPLGKSVLIFIGILLLFFQGLEGGVYAGIFEIYYLLGDLYFTHGLLLFILILILVGQINSNFIILQLHWLGFTMAWFFQGLDKRFYFKILMICFDYWSAFLVYIPFRKHYNIGIRIMHQEFQFGKSKLVFFFDDDRTEKKDNQKSLKIKSLSTKVQTMGATPGGTKIMKENRLVTDRNWTKPSTCAKNKRNYKNDRSCLRMGTANGVGRAQIRGKKQAQTEVFCKNLSQKNIENQLNSEQNTGKFLSYSQIRAFHGPHHLFYKQKSDYLLHNNRKPSLVIHQSKIQTISTPRTEPLSAKIQTFISVYQLMVTKFEFSCQNDCRMSFSIPEEHRNRQSRVYFYKAESSTNLSHNLKLCCEINPVESKFFKIKPGFYKVFYQDGKKLLLDIFSQTSTNRTEHNPKEFNIKIITNCTLQLGKPQILQKFQGRIEDSESFYCPK